MPIFWVEGEIQPRGMAMEQSDAGMSLWDVFGEIPDHRDSSGQRFSLQSILAITLAAMLAGRSNSRVGNRGDGRRDLHSEEDLRRDSKGGKRVSLYGQREPTPVAGRYPGSLRRTRFPPRCRIVGMKFARQEPLKKVTVASKSASWK